MKRLAKQAGPGKSPSQNQHGSTMGVSKHGRICSQFVFAKFMGTFIEVVSTLFRRADYISKLQHKQLPYHNYHRKSSKLCPENACLANIYRPNRSEIPETDGTLRKKIRLEHGRNATLSSQSRTLLLSWRWNRRVLSP